MKHVIDDVPKFQIYLQFLFPKKMLPELFVKLYIYFVAVYCLQFFQHTDLFRVAFLT